MTGTGTHQTVDPTSASLAFCRGWVATTTPVAHDVADTWTPGRIGPLHLRTDPSVSVAGAADGAWSALVIGNVVDLERPAASPARVAQSVATRAATAGIEAAVRDVAYLAGRYVVMLWDGRELTVLPDCVASMPVYWLEQAGRLSLSSHAHLLAEVTGAEPDLAAKQLFVKARTMETPGTLYWPGVTTPFVGVRPLLPNHALTRSDRVVRHTRFYPFPDTTLVTDPDQAYERYRELFLTHVAALCRLGRTGISLTGGSDSRATFAAALPHLGSDALTWTYYNFKAPHAGMQADLLAANELARQSSVAHQVVAVEATKGTSFDAAYVRTFRHTPQFAALAHAYHHQLPADVVELQSMVAEVGTGFYKRRTGSPTIDRLAYLYSPHPFGALPEVLAALEDFVHYADFRADKLGALDFHDVYYWETRIGRWGTLRMQEIDLAHQLMLPFNARGIVEALMGPALPERVEKQALRRLIADPPQRTQARRWFAGGAPRPARALARRR